MPQIAKKYHLPTRISEDYVYVTKVLWLSSVWSLRILPGNPSYKRWNQFTTSQTPGTPSASLEEAPQKSAGWRLCSWLFSLVWCVQHRKLQLRQKPQRYPHSAHLGEGLVSLSACVYEMLLFFNFFILLKDNCFTEFCCFLSNLNMNQP